MSHNGIISKGDSILVDFVYEKNDVYKVLDSEFGVTAWGKIYTRSIFSKLRFPAGMNCEDTYIISDVLDQCDTVLSSSKGSYCYRLNPNSILQSLNTQTVFDACIANCRSLKWQSKHNPRLTAGYVWRAYYYSNILYAIRANLSKKDYRSFVGEMRRYRPYLFMHEPFRIHPSYFKFIFNRYLLRILGEYRFIRFWMKKIKSQTKDA